MNLDEISKALGLSPDAPKATQGADGGNGPGREDGLDEPKELE